MNAVYGKFSHVRNFRGLRRGHDAYRDGRDLDCRTSGTGEVVVVPIRP